VVFDRDAQKSQIVGDGGPYRLGGLMPDSLLPMYFAGVVDIQRVGLLDAPREPDQLSS
jgi:hypothetical protein